MVAIDALGPGGAYRTRKREIVTDTSGVPIAELSLVPPLYVARTVGEQRRTKPLPVADRRAALAAAQQIFAAAADFDAYVELASRASGLPLAITRAGAQVVVDALGTAFDSVLPAQPVGAALDWRARRTRDDDAGAVWVRRGEVFAVHASGNAPGIHALWLQALALGYRVAVRPSRREPFTAHRLIDALRAAGFQATDAVYLPTDYAGADELIHCADLGMVYGGQGVVDKYAGDPRVFVNGPGRTKILITAEHDWRDYLDTIVDSIADLGGMACVNATAVLLEGDPAPLAAAIAERLAAIDPALLPTQPIAQAKAITDHLAAAAAGATAVLGADQVVADLGDGRAALRPAVHVLATPTAAIDTELAFPNVWVARWSRADGIAPLRKSLVLNAITDDEDLVDDLLAEPTIANVYTGRVATHHTAPGLPHDGFLADFLMRNKGFVRGQ